MLQKYETVAKKVQYRVLPKGTPKGSLSNDAIEFH